MWLLICSGYVSYPIRYLLQKGKLVLRSLLSKGRYFRGSLPLGFANQVTSGGSLLSRGRCFRNFSVAIKRKKPKNSQVSDEFMKFVNIGKLEH